MYPHSGLQSAYPAAFQPTEAAELRQRILKLRWIGRDDEAERLAGLLSRSELAGFVIIGPLETD